MEAARPRGARRRPRRGTVDRPVNGRLVRVALLLVAPAFAAILFSISTVGALPASTLAPVFDSDAAAALEGQLSTEYPSRIPGTAEAKGAADWYTQSISALGLATERNVWHQDVSGLGQVELRNVVTVVPGRSPAAIVLVSHRDNAGVGVPLGDNASGTAALIELARSFAPQATQAPRPQHTIVLVSTDAGAYGGVGAARFAAHSPYMTDALAVIVLDGIGGRGPPRISVAGDAPRSPAPTLVGTASARIREQTGAGPLLAGVPTQLVDLGFPYAGAEQGPFLARGVAALTVTTDDPSRSSFATTEQPSGISMQRLGQLGRATDALVSSIDSSAGAAFPTPDSIFFNGRAASGWTVRLTLIVALVPFSLAALDLLVRSRRRRLPLAAAARALRARILFWLYAGVLLWLGGLMGVLPTGAAAPLPPYASSVVDPALAGLTLLGVLLGLGWLVARRRLAPRPQSRTASEERLAGYTVALAWLGLVALGTALLNPYSILFVLPSLYAWLWLPLRSRVWARAALYVTGLAGPVAALLLLGRELGLGPYRASLYVAGLATNGYLSLGALLLVLAWAAAAGQLGALAFGRYAPYGAGQVPPPRGVLRGSVTGLARRARGARYARAR